MCMNVKSPTPPPLPEAPPPDPKPVAEGVKAARAKDKQTAAYRANQAKGASKSAASGLLTPATTAQGTGTLIGG